eukprot:scaffold88888_cov55-Attheya_sp.AAC.2
MVDVNKILSRPMRRGIFQRSSLLVVLVVSWCVWVRAVEANVQGGGKSNTIPRSTHSRHATSTSANSAPATPPWNPSQKIDEDGFLTEFFERIPGEWEEEAGIGGRHGPRHVLQLRKIPVMIRQVPGDGNCLFHSLATCLSYANNGTHVSMQDTQHVMRCNSALLRQQAVDCLSQNPKRWLFLQGHEYLRARDLVDAAASQYDMTGERYCELMRKDSYWGGGPEIVALCNVLKRPIHVYELASHHPDNEQRDVDEKKKEDESVASGGESSSSSPSPGRSNSKRVSRFTKQAAAPQFRLRRMACFGSPKFDRREPLHILSADSRFPDISPGKQLNSGNHFLAMFPVSSGTIKNNMQRHHVRGGAGKSSFLRPNNDKDDKGAASDGFPRPRWWLFFRGGDPRDEMSIATSALESFMLDWVLNFFTLDGRRFEIFAFVAIFFQRCDKIWCPDPLTFLAVRVVVSLSKNAQEEVSSI